VVEPKPELQCMFAWIVPGTCQARATSIPGLRVDLRASLRTFSQRSAIADAFLTQERSRCRLRKYSESLRYSLHSVISSHLSECLFDSSHDIREHQFVGCVSSDTTKSNILNSFYLHSIVTFYTEMQKKKSSHIFSQQDITFSQICRID